jgi:hypothetical protein
MAPIFRRLGLDQRLLESAVAELFEPRVWISNRRDVTSHMPERARTDLCGRRGSNLPGATRPRTRELLLFFRTPSSQSLLAL